LKSAGQADGRAKTRIGRYAVTGRLGRGGMGIVYRGYDETLERAVAIKVLTVEGSLDDESRRRFEIEAKAAARLQHPNILTVYELGEDRGVPFIAMELLSGADLESLVRSGIPLLLSEKLDVLIQVCRGLAFAHEHGIVHRDMKPSNVRILDDGTAKIMDFGIAKLLGTSLTRSGMMVGTVHYMSPEQIRAQPLDGRSDVFSVGVMLYELLAGRRPFVGEDPTQVLYKIVTEAAPEIEADLGDHGPQLRAIVARATAKDVESRLPGAARLADELSEALAAATKAAPLPREGQETLATARRLLKDGRASESVARLRGVVDRNPDSLEARRALRAATLQTARAEKAAETEAATFPELEATFRPAITATQPETGIYPATQHASQPTVLAQAAAPPAAPTPSRRAHPGLWVTIGALATALAIVLAVRLSPRRTPVAAASPPAASPSRPPAAASPPAKAPAKAVAVAAAHGEAKASPEPALPPGTLAVRSSYPLDVTWRGKVLAKGEVSPRVSIPAGRQTVTLASATYALNMTVAVEIGTGAEANLAAPPLGRISVRATPDNCEVLIDGAFLDYPPILDRPVAAGSRTVAFKWPDGTRREEKVEIADGNLSYVTGRKD
jgi:eukaryotic-like serine/threonine-protein kinase